MPSREIWVADCETDPFDGKTLVRPFIWGCMNIETREYHQFGTTREFLDFITAIKCVVYAHNGGKFDWHFVLDDIPEFSRVMVIAGRLAKFQIGEAEFRDSFNIMPMALAAVQKSKVDYNIFKPGIRDIPKNRRIIEDYLKDDCVDLANMLTAFFQEFGFHLTQAGASLKAWEKITNQKAPQTNEEFFKTIAPYYYGGRVEVFESGVFATGAMIADNPEMCGGAKLLPPDGFGIYDVNSMYPFAMVHMHPWGETVTISDTLPNSRGAIERSFITLTAPSLGALPWREKRGDKLTFPADGMTRRFQITGWEFFAAKETGHLPKYEIEEVATLPLAINFKEYVDHFSQMKIEAKERGFKDGKWVDPFLHARYEFAKKFINSIYGKLGANPEEYEEYTVMGSQFIEAAQEEEGYAFCAELGPWALMSRPIHQAQRRYYNVATAASVTGFGRAYLWRAICKCKGVIYCDTDGIMCRDGSALELHPTKLGAWDLEAECDFGAIAGKKLYAAHKKKGGWKKASKGVRLSTASIIRIAKGARVTHNPIAPSFSLKRGVKFQPRNIQMRI